MSVVMMLRIAHDAAEIERAGDAGDRPGIERQQRRLHRLVDRDGAAAALRDLQRLAVAQRGELAVEIAQIARGQRADIGVDRRRRGALVLAPFRHQIGRAGDEHVGRDAPAPCRARACSCSGWRKDHRKQMAMASTPSPTRRRIAASASASLSGTTTVPKQSTRSDTPATRRFGTIGSGFWLSGKCTTRRTSRPPTPREPRMMWMTSLWPARGDEADARAALLHHGVGADGGAVRQQRHLRVEAIRRRGRASGRAVDGVDHALREIIGGGGRLGGGDGAAFVDHDTVGEGAADIDADQIRAHPRFPLAAGLARPFCRYSRARPPSPPSRSLIVRSIAGGAHAWSCQASLPRVIVAAG